jgi:hypothetical protein
MVLVPIRVVQNWPAFASVTRLELGVYVRLSASQRPVQVSEHYSGYRSTSNQSVPSRRFGQAVGPSLLGTLQFSSE